MNILRMYYGHKLTPLSRVFRRKVLLVTSGLGVSLALALLGGYYQLKLTGGWSLPAWLPLLLLLTMILFFMLGFGALTWTVMAEIMPAKVRSILGFAFLNFDGFQYYFHFRCEVSYTRLLLHLLGCATLVSTKPSPT